MPKEYMNVPETIWGNLGHQFKFTDPPETCKDVIINSGFDWEVEALPLYSEKHSKIPGYHVISRTSDNTIIGVVNNVNPQLIQNIDMFRIIEDGYGSQFLPVTCYHMNGIKDIFGIFKLNQSLDVLGNNIDQYFIVLNDHMKVDGKLTIIYAPIHTESNNMISYILPASNQKFRIPTYLDVNSVSTYTSLMDILQTCSYTLSSKLEQYIELKLDSNNIDNLVNELFPLKGNNSETFNDKQNEQQQIAYYTFMDCMDESYLSGYENTGYQVFQAIVDFSQHYYSNLDKCYDLSYRMSMLPTLGYDKSKLIKQTVTYLNKLLKDK